MGKNDKDVHIKVTDYSDKSGAKIDFYDKSPKDPDHKSVHVKVDYDNKSYTTVDNVKGEKETSSGSCYLTSACMKHFQESFDDNCYELTVLRWFRDNFVPQEDIAHYYQTAPVIVAAIDKCGKGADIAYDYIYENVVRTCVEAIENGDYDFAYQRYKSSTLALEEQFARKEYQSRLVKAMQTPALRTV